MTPARRREAGQGLPEFALALVPFLFLLMGVFDFGRGVHTNNGVAEAAREIARATSVHICTSPCSTSTYSGQTAAAIATQKRLVPGLTDGGVLIDCSDIANATVAVANGATCPPGDYIRVTVTVSFHRVTPFLPIPDPLVFRSIAHIQIP